MKEIMIAAAMVVGLSTNAQVMIGEINDTTVSIMDTHSGCVISYFNWGELIHQDTTETIPNNYNHISGSFPKVEEAPAKKSNWVKLNEWCIRNANTNYSGRYYGNSHRYDGVIYRWESPYTTVTTRRYGNTFRTTVVKH